MTGGCSQGLSLDLEEAAGEWAHPCQRWQFARQLTTDLELEQTMGNPTD